MNKTLVIAVLIGIVLGGALGYALAPKSAPAPLAASVTAYNCLNNAALCNALNSIIADLQAVRNPLSGIVQSSTVITGLPSISSSTLLGTSTLVIGLPAALGDTVLISPQSTSTPGISWVATVEVASTSNATFRIAPIYASSTANGGTISIPTPLTFDLTVLPFATLKVPAALITTTSTSF